MTPVQTPNTFLEPPLLGDRPNGAGSPNVEHGKALEKPAMKQPDSTQSEGHGGERSESLALPDTSHTEPVVSSSGTPRQQVRLKAGSKLNAWLEHDAKTTTGFSLLQTLHQIGKQKNIPISTCIAEFEFSSEEVKINFLKELATLEPKEFAENFSSFGIQHLEHKISLGLACGPETLNFINEFDLDSKELPSFLFALSQDSNCAAFIVSYFEKYDIGDDADKERIALACSESNPLATGNHIDQLNIQNNSLRLKIALRYFHCTDSADARQLKEFNLEKDAAGFRCAALAAAGCIRNKYDVIEFARIILNKKSLHPKNEPIQTEKIDLLLEASLYCPEDVAELFDDYFLEQREKLIFCKNLSAAARFFLDTLLTKAQCKHVYDQARASILGEYTNGSDENDSSAMATLWRNKHPELKDKSEEEVLRHRDEFLERECTRAKNEAQHTYLTNRLRNTDANTSGSHGSASTGSSTSATSTEQESPVSVAEALGLKESLGNEQSPRASLVRWVRGLWFLLVLKNRATSDRLEKLRPAIRDLSKQSDEGFRSRMTFMLTALDDESLSRIDSKDSKIKKFPLPALLPAILHCKGLIQSVEGLPPKTFKNGFNLRQFMNTVMSLWSLREQKKLPETMLDKLFPKSSTDNSSSRKRKAPKSTSDVVLLTPSTQSIDVPVNTTSLSSASSSAASTQDNSFQGIIGRLAKVRIVAEIDENLAVSVAQGQLNVNEALRDIVINRLGVPPSQYAKFEEIFLKYRDPITILIYLNAIRYQTVALRALQRLVRSVLAGKYPEVKYLADPLLEKMNPVQASRWRENRPSASEKKMAPDPSSSRGRLVFTDGHQDMMRMGSDVVGSCQRVDGDGSLNRGLIGTMMDGKHKLVALKGEDGQIVARAVLRLMSTIDPNPTDQSEAEKNPSLAPAPCLLMEKIYPPNCQDEIKHQLVNLALQQAKYIGIPIAASSDVDLPADKLIEPCKQTLYSGTLAYPVYCDALSGMQDTAFMIAPDKGKPLSWFS